jgi:hypothetical protein
MNVYKELPIEDQNEDEQVFTRGDDILMSFYYGQFIQGIKEMISYSVNPNELAQYLEEKADEYDMQVSELYSGHFTLAYFASIGEAYRDEEISLAG